MPGNEFRIDPLSGQRSLIAPARADRPGARFKIEPAPPIDASKDPFAEGSEQRTPDELYALRPGGGEPNSPGWKVRVVPNLYPALTPDAPEPEFHHDRDLYTAYPASGDHEVIINSQRSVISLSELTEDELSMAVGVWRERMRHHGESAYVHVIVNERAEAGASLPHTHTQLYALDFVPANVARERERFTAYSARTMGSNLLDNLLQEEVRLRKRLVAYDDEAVVLAPYATRFPYEMMLVPRQPEPSFADSEREIAPLLRTALLKLRTVLGELPPLNIWIRTAPRGSEGYCWRIVIAPRLTHLAGLELGAGVNVSIVPPETAAQELREASPNSSGNA